MTNIRVFITNVMFQRRPHNLSVGHQRHAEGGARDRGQVRVHGAHGGRGGCRLALATRVAVRLRRR